MFGIIAMCILAGIIVFSGICVIKDFIADKDKNNNIASLASGIVLVLIAVLVFLWCYGLCIS